MKPSTYLNCLAIHILQDKSIFFGPKIYVLNITCMQFSTVNICRFCTLTSMKADKIYDTVTKFSYVGQFTFFVVHLSEFLGLWLPQIKMIVVLGELGGQDEYSLVEALKQGKVTKPVVAWVSGTCARLFKSEVQFGHAVSNYLNCLLLIFG